MPTFAKLLIAVSIAALLGCSPANDDAASNEAKGTGLPDAAQTGESEADAPGADGDSVAAVDPAAANSATKTVSVSPIDPGELEQVLAKSRGKIVLIDFWATWCVPCIKGLPHTVGLADKYDDLVVITLAMEGVEQQEAVLKTLQAVEATTMNFVSKADAVQAMEDFEISSGTIPTLRLYGRDGALHTTFGDGDPEPINFEAIEVAIRDLL